MKKRELRREMFMELGRQFDEWRTETDQQLLARVKSQLSMVTSATRDECLKFLTMTIVEKMVM